MIKIKSAFAVTALAVSACTSAFAAVGLSEATISIDTFLTGGTGASGNTAVVATLFMEANGANVDFKLSNSLNNLAAGGNGFLTELLLSYDNDPVITGSNVGNFGGTQLATGATVDSGLINDASYKFKISFDYPTNGSGGGIDRFTNGEYSTWTITGVTIEDFLTADAANNGALAMVHLQGLGTNSYSVKYVGDLDDGPTDPGGNPAPEPGSLALVGLALAGLGCMSRRKRA